MRSHIELDSDSGSSDDESEEETNVQFLPGDEGKGGYERKIPDRFSADSDDLFMRSMITTYATEEETEEDKKTGYKGGEPTGVFTMTKPKPRPPPSKFLEPIRDSLEPPPMPISAPTGLRPGDISMSTEPVRLQFTECQSL